MQVPASDDGRSFNGAGTNNILAAQTILMKYCSPLGELSHVSAFFQTSKKDVTSLDAVSQPRLHPGRNKAEM